MFFKNALFCDDISKGFRTSNISGKYHLFLDDYHVIQDWMYYSLRFDFWIDKKLQFNIHSVFLQILLVYQDIGDKIWQRLKNVITL